MELGRSGKCSHLRRAGFTRRLPAAMIRKRGRSVSILAGPVSPLSGKAWNTRGVMTVLGYALAIIRRQTNPLRLKGLFTTATGRAMITLVPIRVTTGIGSWNLICIIKDLWVD